MNQTTLCPKEGWNVLHLFYWIDYAAWRLLNDKDRLNAKAAMSALLGFVNFYEFSERSPKICA
jgi:hypothetical protein